MLKSFLFKRMKILVGMPWSRLRGLATTSKRTSIWNSSLPKRSMSSQRLVIIQTLSASTKSLTTALMKSCTLWWSIVLMDKFSASMKKAWPSSHQQHSLRTPERSYKSVTCRHQKLQAVHTYVKARFENFPGRSCKLLPICTRKAIYIWTSNHKTAWSTSFLKSSWQTLARACLSLTLTIPCLKWKELRTSWPQRRSDSPPAASQVASMMSGHLE